MEELRGKTIVMFLKEINGNTWELQKPNGKVRAKGDYDYCLKCFDKLDTQATRTIRQQRGRITA